MPETTSQEEFEPTETEEEGEREGEEETGTVESPEKAGLLSPEGIIMICLALLLDGIGVLLLIVSLVSGGAGEYFSYFVDFVGLILIGAWMFSRSGAIRGPKGIKKISAKALKRVGLAFLGELIPFIGDIVPCWTIAVYYELKSK